MVEIEQRSVCDGVSFRSIKDTKFKTVRMSVNLMLPLDKQTVAKNAILPFLLSRASREYPDFTKLGERLSELYGAEINADTQKLGDVQLLSISATGIADRYALNKEKVSTELSGLLCSILFDPPFENGMFPEQGFEQEKRQTIELIESEYNDKRTYARLRCEELMCADEPYGIGRYGSKEDVRSLKREELTDSWKYLIQNSKIEILVLGDCDPIPVYDKFVQSFRQINKNNTVPCPTQIVKSAKKVNEVTEEADVAQSKLVLGFRTFTAVPEEEVWAVKLMSALYGGTPSSKLFLNVREKLSLCYYCSALYNSIKGIMLVQSGVETKNVERAQQEILLQLDELKKGNFSDDELETAKLSLCNSYRSVSDSLGSLEGWYLSQTFSSKIQQPEEAVELVQAITRQQVIDAASNVTLDTVYKMIGKGEHQ